MHMIEWLFTAHYSIVCLFDMLAMIRKIEQAIMIVDIFEYRYRLPTRKTLTDNGYAYCVF